MKIKKRVMLHPIMSFLILIFVAIFLSAILKWFGISTSYNMINTVKGDYDSVTLAVNSLLNLSGLKLIFKTTVSNFATFTPLVMLLITLIGIGIMDKSGFLQSFFALITHNANKFRVTVGISFLMILSSIIGDLAFIIFIPITALFFKYSKRNPKAGIVLAFACLTCGTGINILMNSIDSSLLEYTKLAANSLDPSYTINIYAHFYIMIVMSIIMSFVIAGITEKITIPNLGKYEIEDPDEEFYLDKKKKRGLLFSLTVSIVYLLFFIYNIIPGLPLSGSFLDYSQTLYIDKLFGYNSFFNQGFVFIITFGFILCGLFYGIGAKTIKDHRDVCDYLGHSLDGIGKSLVFVLFASTLISIFKDTNIGNVLISLVANFISNSHMTGITLVIVSFIMIALLTLLVPSPVTSWSILSSTLVPVFMNAGMTPEFAGLVFRGAQCTTYCLTPLMAYYVIYLAFMNTYSKEDELTNMSKITKYLVPYAIATGAIWLTVLIIAYVLGLPIGIGAHAVL